MEGKERKKANGPNHAPGAIQRKVRLRDEGGSDQIQFREPSRSRVDECASAGRLSD